MKTLSLNESSSVMGGAFIDRLMKQWYKCLNGSGYACARVNRMAARHNITVSQEVIDNYEW